MAWIDYEKAYDMVHHSWIGECLEMFGLQTMYKTSDWITAWSHGS